MTDKIEQRLEEIEASFKHQASQWHEDREDATEILLLIEEDGPALCKALRRQSRFVQMIHDISPDHRESALSMQKETLAILSGEEGK